MRRSLLIAFFLVISAGTATAQRDRIYVFADPMAYDAFFIDNGGLISVYVFHMYSDGATASEWMLDVTDAGWSHLADQPTFDLVIGTSIAGVSIAYEVCLGHDFLLMTVIFFSYSPAPPCTEIGIVAAPGKAGVRAVDCAENAVVVRGGKGRVNWNSSCRVPIETTTWGRVKALYGP